MESGSLTMIEAFHQGRVAAQYKEKDFTIDKLYENAIWPGLVNITLIEIKLHEESCTCRNIF